jgi:pyrimidine dimer DNA glycosylase/uncharacterized protein DUF1722
VRIWDVSPGYLNRQSLLGEHRELHGLANILVQGKNGYSRHPETLRWVGCVSGLARRHATLAAEMTLRNYAERTPLDSGSRETRWPRTYVTSPSQQFELLRAKYVGHSTGRIPLPRSSQELWAQHKYSVMARDPAMYRSLGNRVVTSRRRAGIDDLALILVEALRLEAPGARVTTALEHMWGYVRKLADSASRRRANESAWKMLRETQHFAVLAPVPYLLSSTALSDLAMYVRAA